MGRDKALLAIAGEPLVVRVARLVESAVGEVTVVGKPELYKPLKLNAVNDDWPSAGPLGGIATALGTSKVPWSLIVACDLPYLTRSWLNYVVARALASQADAVLPMNAHGDPNGTGAGRAESDRCAAGCAGGNDRTARMESL